MDLREANCWNNHYRTELKNFIDHGEEGDVWFGNRLTSKIVDYVRESIRPNTETRIVDIGCGNVYTLKLLLERYVGFDRSEKRSCENLHLLGIDYVSESIALSEKILESCNLLDKIKLAQCDFLNHDQVVKVTAEAKYDFIIDKGTYDAIILMSDGEEAHMVNSKYMKSLYALAKPGTIYILASCNNTEEELEILLRRSPLSDLETKIVGRIECPTFKFGGSEGSQTCCLIVQFMESSSSKIS